MRAEEEKMRGSSKRQLTASSALISRCVGQREKAGQILQSLLFLYLCLSAIDQIYVYSKCLFTLVHRLGVNISPSHLRLEALKQTSVQSSPGVPGHLSLDPAFPQSHSFASPAYRRCSCQSPWPLSGACDSESARQYGWHRCPVPARHC